MGDAPDHQRLAAEVLGIRNAPPELARRLVAQALVVEDRRDGWRRAGERIVAERAATPGVYVLRDEGGPRAVRRQGRTTCGGGCARIRGPAVARLEGAARARRRRGVARGRIRARGAAARSRADSRAAARGERPDRRARARRRERFPPRSSATSSSSCRRSSWIGRARRRARRRRLADSADAARTAADSWSHAARLMRFFNSPLRRSLRRSPAARADRVLVAGRTRERRDAARSATRPRTARRACGRVCARCSRTSALFTERIVVIDSEIRRSPPTPRRVNASSSPHAPLAQLDRASGYEPGGRRFESCRAHHLFPFTQLPLRVSSPSDADWVQLAILGPTMRSSPTRDAARRRYSSS